MTRYVSARWDELLARAPVNKQAAVVAGQAGCSDEERTPEQRRENLVARAKRLIEQAQELPRRHPQRLRMGQEIQRLQEDIRAIRPKRRGSEGLANYIVDICKERMTKVEFDLIVQQAMERMESDQ